jgi:hypothetical protein
MGESEEVRKCGGVEVWSRPVGMEVEEDLKMKTGGQRQEGRVNSPDRSGE